MSLKHSAADLHAAVSGGPVPCAATPGFGRDFFHPEGFCGCFYGGPPPTRSQSANPAAALTQSAVAA